MSQIPMNQSNWIAPFRRLLFRWTSMGVGLAALAMVSGCQPGEGMMNGPPTDADIGDLGGGGDLLLPVAHCLAGWFTDGEPDPVNSDCNVVCLSTDKPAECGRRDCIHADYFGLIGSTVVSGYLTWAVSAGTATGVVAGRTPATVTASGYTELGTTMVITSCSQTGSLSDRMNVNGTLFTGVPSYRPPASISRFLDQHATDSDGGPASWTSVPIPL